MRLRCPCWTRLGLLPRRRAPASIRSPETASTSLVAASRALLRLAVTHPYGERAVAAVLAAVGVEKLGDVPPRTPAGGRSHCRGSAGRGGRRSALRA
jgi:hypothetical protein